MARNGDPRSRTPARRARTTNCRPAGCRSTIRTTSRSESARHTTISRSTRSVAYVASLGNGPPLPQIDLKGADVAAGGELFRANCAPCHSASGAGGALSYGAAAPPLSHAEPLQVAAAVRSGPGQMPVFGPDQFDDEQLRDLAAYVQYLRHPNDPAAYPSVAPGPCPKASSCGSSAWARSSRWWRGSVRAHHYAAGPMPDAPWDSRARAEITATVCFGVSTLAAIGLAIVYWRGGNTQAEGALLTLVTGGIGVGIIVWAKEAMPQDEVTEERPSVASSEEEVEAFAADFEAGKEELGRRRLLFGLAASAFAAFGAALLFRSDRSDRAQARD